MTKIKIATGLIKRFLKFVDKWAVTTHRGIYVLPEHLYNAGLIAHERIHADQIRRMGAVKFYLKYFLYQAWYGYEKNPLEVEARKLSGFR